MLNLIAHGSIREINLARAPVNALNLALLQALRAAVDDSVRDGARGIVLAASSLVAQDDAADLALLDRPPYKCAGVWRRS